MSDVLNRLIEKVENRYYGKYRATVAYIDDPDQMGRIKLVVPELLGDNNTTGWALPCLPCGGFKESGFCFIPEIKSNVWVEFEGGNLSYPIWTGTWWDNDKAKIPIPIEENNNIKILKTRAGHKIEFSDEEKNGNITIETDGKHQFILDDRDGHQNIQIKSKEGHIILIDDAGKKIQIKTKSGNEITMDDSGGKITMKDVAGDSIVMGASDIKIESKGALSIKGMDVKIESSGMMTVKAGGILTVQGSLIKLN